MRKGKLAVLLAVLALAGCGSSGETAKAKAHEEACNYLKLEPGPAKEECEHPELAKAREEEAKREHPALLKAQEAEREREEAG